LNLLHSCHSEIFCLLPGGLFFGIPLPQHQLVSGSLPGEDQAQAIATTAKPPCTLETDHSLHTATYLLGYGTIYAVAAVR